MTKKSSRKPGLAKNSKFKLRYLSIFSRHPSVAPLRHTILLNKKAIYRHGSTTEHESNYEINSVQAVRTSASKLLMKKAFDSGGVKHLPWFPLSVATANEAGVSDGKINIKYPVIIKHHYGSRGTGNTKIDSLQDFNNFIVGKTKGNYLVEQFFSGSAEFRIHITSYGPIYNLRKRLKNDVPEKNRWVRNDSTCIWITEFDQNKVNNNFVSFKDLPNPSFDKPSNWDEIIEECKKALKAVGGDLLAVDVKAQTNTTTKGKRREKVDFYVLEVNSAPAMGEITKIIYKEHIPKVLKHKYGNF